MCHFDEANKGQVHKEVVNHTYRDVILHFSFLSKIYKLLCNLQKEQHVLEAPLYISLSLGLGSLFLHPY